MRRGMKILLAVAAVIALLTVTGVALLREVFVVRNVLIAGETSATDVELIRGTQIEMSSSIFRVDEAQMRRSLESSGRFALEGVEVEYPNTVILQVRERTRDAMVLNGGKILVMDSDGYVIEVCDTMPENSGVYVTGLDGTSYRIGSRFSAPEDKLTAMKIITEAVREQNAAMYVSELNLDNLMSMWMITRTGIRVELGDSDSMDQKILWLRSVVADLERRGETSGTLDVSGGNKADYRP